MPADPLDRERDMAQRLADDERRPYMLVATAKGVNVQPLAAKPRGAIIWMAFPTRDGKDGDK